MNLSFQKFQEIIKKGYAPDSMFILEYVSQGVDITSDSKKVENIILTARRKGLLTDDNKITIEGQNLLDFIKSEDTNVTIIQKKVTKEDDFLLWWKEYPSTDSFTYKNKTFKGSRALRVKKEECKTKLAKILNEGEYTITDMIEALKLEIHQKAENSLKTGVNKMSYFQNSLTYLNQGTHEPFIDLYKQGVKIDESKKLAGGVDI